MFSEIAGHFHQPMNALYRERDRLRVQGRPIVDLVSGNVNEHGIIFPQDALKRILAHAARDARIYRPDPFGQPAAREAISGFYRDQGLAIPPEQILITPGTSVSYEYAFKLLANPGEEILAPAPKYPLFDAIAALSGVMMISYRLREDDRWEIDFDSFQAGLSPKTRAIVLISPHNPTGAVADRSEVAELARLASEHDLAIIADEVFSPFIFRGGVRGDFARPAATQAPLVLTLNGFSKMFALPGMKIGWMAVSGDPARVKKALAALEMISDTFLPVNEIAQFAVPAIFEQGPRFLGGYQREIRKRADLAQRLLSKAAGASFIRPEGGFYLALRIKDANVDEESSALELLRKENLLVHPGYFYDLEPPHWVFSFVSEPALLETSLRKIADYFG